MLQHPSFNDPDVLQAADDFHAVVLEIRDLTRPLVGMRYDDPRRNQIGAQVQSRFDGIDLRAERLGMSGLTLFELINMAIDAERVAVAA